MGGEALPFDSDVASIRRDLPDLAQHDLKAIAESAGLDLSADEEDLMDVLKECILWPGRYPTPIRRHEYGELFSQGTPLNRFFEGGSIFGLQLPLPEEIEVLITRLVAELRTIPEDQRA